jgi:hypothetical protein
MGRMHPPDLDPAAQGVFYRSTTSWGRRRPKTRGARAIDGGGGTESSPRGAGEAEVTREMVCHRAAALHVRPRCAGGSLVVGMVAGEFVGQRTAVT